jgi:hypothetical protein
MSSKKIIPNIPANPSLGFDKSERRPATSNLSLSSSDVSFSCMFHTLLLAHRELCLKADRTTVPLVFRGGDQFPVDHSCLGQHSHKLCDRRPLTE